ncbi:MAG TPA: hypothetical protein VGJ95_00910 [Pseudonocardiaceae bacterium]|jgi:hypothetical protein
MSYLKHRWLVVVGLATTAAVVAAAPGAAEPGSISTGPSTKTPPYVLPSAEGVHITSLLTVDDAGSASNGYEMVGIPDGLGVRRQGANLVVHMNHELPPDRGIVRAHGQTGAFVSRLVIDPETGEVKEGSDFIQPGIQYWDYLTGSYSAVPNGAGTQHDGDAFPAYDARLGRFCSGTLSAPGLFYDEATGTGFKDQLYFANEEVGDEGRVFAVTKDGEAWQLPRLGLFSWENTVPAPNQSDTTLVMGDEDGGSGQVWVYVGTKQRNGSAVDKAGLTNGDDHVIDLVNEAVSTDAQFRAAYGKGVPAAFDLAENDWDQSGRDQNIDAAADGLSLNRIEDGHWDPNHPNDFYFVTTAGGAGPGSGGGGGLWKASFTDIEQPGLGGTLTLVLDGSEGLYSPDNITIDTHGNLLIQEDPGNNPHVSRIMAYRISDNALATVATFDPAQFAAGAPGFITQDEESSGIIDVEAQTGVAGSFLFDAQVHAAPANNVTEYVERGQLLRLVVDDWEAVYGG